MTNTSNLGLPLMAAAQSQKHVTHNEALLALDSMAQAAVISTSLTAPPVSPAEGDRYIIAATATGAWAGKDLSMTMYSSGAWLFYTPKVGWRVWDRANSKLLIWTGSAWVDYVVQQNLITGSTAEFSDAVFTLTDNSDTTKKAKFEASGISTATTQTYNLPNISGALASLANISQTFTGPLIFSGSSPALTVNSAQVLFNHGGAGVSAVLNKNASTDTNSLDFSTGSSLRARLGNFGTDADFSIRVSTNGSTFLNALNINASSGLIWSTDTSGFSFGGSALYPTFSFTTTIVPAFQVVATSTRASFMIARYENSVASGRLFLTKSRGTSVGADDISVVANDYLGMIIFTGSNGTRQTEGARIVGSVEDTPGTNYVKTALTFETSNGSLIATSLKVNGAGEIWFPRIGTTASAANAFLDSGSNNNLLRSTSSVEYKKDIEPLESKYAYTLLNNAEPIWYRSKCENDNPAYSWYGFGAENIANIDPRMVFFGYKASDYEEVSYETEDGEFATKMELKPDAVKSPQGVMYERFVVHHHLILKDLLHRISKLECRIMNN